MSAFSFDNLPKNVEELKKEIQDLKRIILQKNNQKVEKPEDDILNVEQVANLLDLAKQTIYGKVSRGEIPVMKIGNKLYFSKREILSLLKSGRQKTETEIQLEAEEFLSNRKKGLNYGK